MTKTLGSQILFLALAAAGISFVPAAQASPVNYNFTVTVTSGSLAGTVQNGSFSYDSSISSPYGYDTQSGELTAFNFSFDGKKYDASTANTGLLGFDGGGNLNSFYISSSCAQCNFGAGNDNFSLTASPTNGFVYSTPSDFFEYGDVTYSLAGVAVPEPGVLGVFSFGLLLLGGIAARRRLSRLPLC